jgi:hypothetical protein
MTIINTIDTDSLAPSFALARAAERFTSRRGLAG